ncbi:MerR family transcriptional regulator [uncultured Treponema sp.]|uniref:MerR family transcriptional regulator n=1 Tax=uncultured Treponema sp. TaxID=162155 RepID=UPI002595B710|nr:MerR family transcriptional regulator [uncultured Treponema sp.]
MKKNPNLYQIGEVINIVGEGVTRRIILNYEDLGLLIPAEKDPNSGYRYYSADNVLQIKSIRTLQSFGLSLKECKEYYYDKSNIEKHLHRLMKLRETLDRNIQNLQIRAAMDGNLAVHTVLLARGVYFCRRYKCADTKDAAIKLRETYIAASKCTNISKVNKMFTVRHGTEDSSPNDLLMCIPVEDSFYGSERVEFAATKALCIYFRGPYEQIGTAINELKNYIEKNNIKAQDKFRSIYLEGPPQRGTNSADYITQVAVPIS